MDDPLLDYLDGYLSFGHVGALGVGCPIAGLAPELVRAEPEVREAMAVGARRLIEALAADLPIERDARAAAIRVLATAVGTIVLARAVGDEGVARAIIETMRGSQPLASVLSPRADGTTRRARSRSSR
ncbi:hypothetical protein J4558_25230 [Leptolyngbya sp. 15MV]|nr:hypothetical protein J4558_25230 [Leptolyngbya sp. 15MV]